MPVSVSSLRLFFVDHDATELFGDPNPSDEDLQEFLDAGEDQLHEQLRETYNATVVEESGGLGANFSSAGGMPLGK
jgi:hypothetical protein